MTLDMDFCKRLFYFTWYHPSGHFEPLNWRAATVEESKVKYSWWPSACHVFSSDNSTPFSKPGGWRSTLLLVKALLRNFYFISVQFYCVIDGIIWKQYLSLTPCAVFVKDEILALNPPVFASSQRVWMCAFSLHTHMHSYMFVCVSRH